MQQITISGSVTLYLPDDYQKVKVESFNVEEWVAALRSGDYAKTSEGILENNNFWDTKKQIFYSRYCCLGVLCKIKNLTTINLILLDEELHREQFIELDDAGHLPEGCYVEISTNVYQTLSAINDVSFTNFHDIATIIEHIWTN